MGKQAENLTRLKGDMLGSLGGRNSANIGISIFVNDFFKMRSPICGKNNWKLATIIAMCAKFTV